MKQDTTAIEAAAVDEFLVAPGSLQDVVRVLDIYRQGKTQTEVAAALGWKKDKVTKVLSRVGCPFDIDLTERDEDDPSRLAPRVEEFLSYARQVVEGYSGLVRPKAFGVRKVRVGAFPSVISYFLAKLVLPNLLVGELVGYWDGTPDPFPKRFPLYQLEFLDFGSGANTVHEIGRGRLDFGIVDRRAKAPGHAAATTECHPLFASSPRGFLYHKDNKSFGKLAANPTRFSWEAACSHTLILTDGDRASVRDGLFPDPERGVATRVFVNTFAQVLTAVTEEAGVGVGFLPKTADETSRVKHLPFDAIECTWPQDQQRILALKASSLYSFDLCVREGWEKSREEGGLSDAARFVLHAIRATAKGYTHDYVS